MIIRAHLALIALLVVSLAGCTGGKSDPPVIVYKQPKPVYTPAECDNASDPRWRDLSDSDARSREVIDNIAANKRTHKTIANRRAVCAAALIEHGMIKR